MKYYTKKKLKMKRKEKKELLGSLTALEKAILRKAEGGSDIIALIGCGKPFVNKYGSKEFATTDQIRLAIRKLEKSELLERR